MIRYLHPAPFTAITSEFHLVCLEYFTPVIIPPLMGARLRQFGMGVVPCTRENGKCPSLATFHLEGAFT
jgi:hypothetical protein